MAVAPGRERSVISSTSCNISGTSNPCYLNNQTGLVYIPLWQAGVRRAKVPNLTAEAQIKFYKSSKLLAYS